MNRFRELAFSALFILVSATAWAQATAQMSGTVKDESGAVLPGVTVTVTQTDTGFTRAVVTGDAGTYAVPNLPIGPYKLVPYVMGRATSYSQSTATGSRVGTTGGVDTGSPLTRFMAGTGLRLTTEFWRVDDAAESGNGEPSN